MKLILFPRFQHLKHLYILIIGSAIATLPQFLSAQTITPVQTESALPPAKIGLPNLGLDAATQLSPSQERILGRIIWRDLRSDPSIITDPLIREYLQSLTSHLATSVEFSEGVNLRTFAVEDSTLNAFAMPSGLLGVNTGLMLNVAREGELAGVLAHELGHVSQRHFARGMAQHKNSVWIGVAGFAAALIAARNNNAQSTQIIEGAVAGSQALIASQQLRFSRDMEREADAVGLTIVQNLGLDGRDMVRMLRRLGTTNSLNDTGSTYARSHPAIAERMANIQGRLKLNATNPSTSTTTPDRFEFYLMQARLTALLATTGERYDAALAQFNLTISNASINTPQLAAAQYGLAQLAIQHQEWDKAVEYLTTLTAATSPWREHTWVQALAFELNTLQPQQAKLPNITSVNLSTLLNAQPAHAAALYAIEVAVAKGNVLSANESALAQTWLHTWASQHPSHDDAWATLATLYKTHSAADAAYAEAEQTAALGIWASSINSLIQALRLGENTVPITTQNRWQARLAELRSYVIDETAVLSTLHN